MVDFFTILMVVRHWPDIARRAVESIRKFTDAKIILVDDATPNDVTAFKFADISGDFEAVKFYRLTKQVQHGFALDFALARTVAPWVITCDHDMIINSERAFSILLEQAADDVGVVGKAHSNQSAAALGKFAHPSWALWNADAIKKYNLSFAGFGIKGLGPTWDFATAQFTCYRLAGLGLGSADKGATQKPLRTVFVNLGDTVTHAQVWQKRGDTWREIVKPR